LYKISVIIPVFNSSLCLDHCLSTVINQTLEDIEIILIDDGSTDNSLNNIGKLKTDEIEKRILMINKNVKIKKISKFNPRDI